MTFKHAAMKLAYLQVESLGLALAVASLSPKYASNPWYKIPLFRELHAQATAGEYGNKPGINLHQLSIEQLHAHNNEQGERLKALSQLTATSTMSDRVDCFFFHVQSCQALPWSNTSFGHVGHAMK